MAQNPQASDPNPASTNPSHQPSPPTSGATSPPNHKDPQAVALPKPGPSHSGLVSLDKKTKSSQYDISAEDPAAAQRTSGVPKAVLTANGPSISGAPSAPRVLMQAGPSLRSSAPAAADAVSAPELNDIVWSHEKDEVYGNLLVGTDRTDVGPVRFRAFDVASRKRLISNKTGPKENLFWLSSMCTAVDYEAHFNTVCRRKNFHGMSTLLMV